MQVIDNDKKHVVNCINVLTLIIEYDDSCVITICSCKWYGVGDSAFAYYTYSLLFHVMDKKKPFKRSISPHKVVVNQLAVSLPTNTFFA